MSELQTPELYTTLKGEGCDECEERRSVFIGHAKHVTSEEEAQEYVKGLKREYADATHNVWAYILKGGIIARYSDDGEPQGTAGVPVLDTIRKSGVEDAVVVATRYFGGILLGAGGLVRAYSHCAKIALEAAKIITYEKYSVYELDCSYSDYQKYIAILPQYGAITDSTDFSDRVRLRFALKSVTVQPLLDRIREISAGMDCPTFIEERFDYR